MKPELRIVDKVIQDPSIKLTTVSVEQDVVNSNDMTSIHKEVSERVPVSISTREIGTYHRRSDARPC